MKLVLRAYVATQGVTFYRGPLTGTCFPQAAAKGRVAARALGGAGMNVTAGHIHANLIGSRCTRAVMFAHTLGMHPSLLHDSYSSSSAMVAIHCMCAVVEACDRPLKHLGARLSSVQVELRPSGSSDTGIKQHCH